MTPAKKAALEALRGSALSPEQESVIDGLIAQGNHDAVAAVLSAGRTKLASYEAGKGDVLNVLGLTVGNALLDVIDSAPEFRHAKHLLADGRLRLDMPLTMGTLASLVGQQIAAGITFEQAHADAILALARVPDPINHEAVTAALRGAE